MALNDVEWVIAAALSADGRIGLIAGDEGSVFVWKNYPNMEEWKAWSIERIRDRMMGDEILRGSEIFQEISAFAPDGTMSGDDGETGGTLRTGGGKRFTSDSNREDGGRQKANGSQRSMPGGDGEAGDPARADSGQSFWRDMLDDDTLTMRIVTMAVLFFLVQILVRLHQYNLRLAAFWESRADAVLLAQSFADRKAHRFDDLVGALAPDAYDFKSPPRSPFDWFRARREP